MCHACSKPAIWKGAHWCGCCPCPCTLIKNLIMIWIWYIGYFFFSSSSIYQLTLKPPITIAAGNNFDYSLFARENNSWHFMWIICQADYSHEMSTFVFSENRENKLRLSSTQILLGTLWVKCVHNLGLTSKRISAFFDLLTHTWHKGIYRYCGEIKAV